MSNSYTLYTRTTMFQQGEDLPLFSRTPQRKMTRRPTAKVQRFCTQQNTQAGAMIRLRGKWIQEVFDIGTQLTIVREERNGQMVLVLEEVK